MKQLPAQGARRFLLGVLTMLLLGTWAATAAADPGTEITNLPVLDSLERNETPLSLSGKWLPLQWDAESSTHKTGKDTTTGWGPYDAFPSINGAYWGATSFSGAGNAASVKMVTNPAGGGERYVSLWLDMSSPGSTKSGYQFKWVENPTIEGDYTLSLTKWSAGTATALGSTLAFTKIPKGTTLAISKKGPSVIAWTNVEGSLKPVLVGTDNSYSSGYAGIEASGNLSRATEFRAGSFGSLGSEVAAVPTVDTLQREENPLSNEGKWTALNWASTSIRTGRTTAAEGWNVPSSYTPSGGAYWNPLLLTDAASSDTVGGEVVSARIGKLPTNESRWASIWLDMPSPSTEKSGYQLRWTQEAGSTVGVRLYKWAAGSSTLLASKLSLSIPLGTTIALSDQNKTIRAWTGTGEELGELFSATDSTYSGGYAGIEAAGAYTRLTNFKAGMLPGGPKIEGLPVLDSFNRANETPLSNKKKWQKTAWADDPGRIWGFGPFETGYQSQNWGPTWCEEPYESCGAFKLSGAYWSPSSFAEGETGNAVSVQRVLALGARRSYWLDMPSPGTEKSGYELSVEQGNGTGYEEVLTLSKWTAGTQTVLATKNIGEAFMTRIGLVKKGGLISVWVQAPFHLQDWEYRPEMVVADSTYSSGYIGLQEARFGEGGNANFSGGSLSG
jgi:hypothetical protein